MRSDRELVALADENFVASFAKLAEHSVGGECRRLGGVFAYVSGLPIALFNGCVVVRPCAPDELDAALRWVRALGGPPPGVRRGRVRGRSRRGGACVRPRARPRAVPRHGAPPGTGGAHAVARRRRCLRRRCRARGVPECRDGLGGSRVTWRRGCSRPRFSAIRTCAASSDGCGVARRVRARDPERTRERRLQRGHAPGRPPSRRRHGVDVGRGRGVPGCGARHRGAPVVGDGLHDVRGDGSRVPSCATRSSGSQPGRSDRRRRCPPIPQ